MAILDWLDSLALTIGPGWACCVAIVALPLFFVFAFGGFAYVAIMFGEWRLKQMMRRQLRVMKIDDVRLKLASQSGSLIIEYPYLGWGISRVWWTPDDVVAVSPAEPKTIDDFDCDLTNMTSEPFTEWAVAHYLSATTGRAWLVSVFKSEVLVRKLETQFPTLKKVEVDSELVRLIQPAATES